MGLGLIVGLHSGSHSKLVVVGGILTIAVADAFSDALGIHISEEAENQHSQYEIWESTIVTFLSKFFFTLTFVLSVLFFKLPVAIVISALWGLSLLTIFSFYLTKQQNKKGYLLTLEHLSIALIVIAITHVIGDWINSIFR